MYSDYSFYKDKFLGVLTETEYNRFAVRATAEIDRLTFGRAKTAEGENLDAVKFAECAVIDEIAHQVSGGDITSETNDGISRSFATGIAKSARQRIDAIAHTWLANTNLCACMI